MSSSRPSEIPDIVVDTKTNKRYRKGKFLGKGGFAKCYELEEIDSKSSTPTIFAGKIISKDVLKKENQREKLVQEISIHKSLSHSNIVQFYSHFEDNDNVYILLELCRRRSLMELHKRRQQVTEPEARYFMHQIVLAGIFMHQQNVIHRDLKLGNLFLSETLQIKVGDFGLATKVSGDSDRKRTLCGTPNYIAPEVLNKKGHSFEVDMWSLGCILYTLLIGKPPFETSTLKETYSRIRKGEYSIPPRTIGASATALIKKLLSSEPAARGTMEECLNDLFFLEGFMPANLPLSCLTTAPRFDTLSNPNNTVVINGNVVLGAALPVPASSRPLRDLNSSMRETARLALNSGDHDNVPQQSRAPTAREASSDAQLSHLRDIVEDCLNKAALIQVAPDEEMILDPASTPIYWVAKWVDYSDKYGLGYQLCDNSVGVLFNDQTRLILASNEENLQYIEKDNREHLCTMTHYLEHLSKKVTLLRYFRSYMNDHLLKAGANIQVRHEPCDEMTRLPFLKCWFRTRNAIVLHLSNGILQINFFTDHTKIFLCPLMEAVTYIDENRGASTYRLDLIGKHGCSVALLKRLQYALSMVQRMISGQNGQPLVAPPASQGASNGNARNVGGQGGPYAPVPGAAAGGGGAQGGRLPPHMQAAAALRVDPRGDSGIQVSGTTTNTNVQRIQGIRGAHMV